jgi:drug/metabolite transporter (DMT)-like permease
MREALRHEDDLTAGVMMTVAMAAFAGAWPAAAVALESVSLLTISVIRWSLAIVPLSIAFVVIDRRAWRMEKETVILVVLLSLTSVVGYTFTWLGGIALSPANNGVFLVPASMPIFAALGARLLLGEAVGRIRWLGIALGTVGMAVIISEGGVWSASRLAGDFLFLVTGGLWAAYLIVYRLLSGRLAPIAAITLATAAGLLILGPLSLVMGDPWSGMTNLSGEAAVSLVYLALGGTAIPILLSFSAVRRSKVIGVAQFGFLIPVFGVLFNSLILGEVLTVRQGIGGAVAILGIIVASLAMRSRATAT